MKDKIIHVPEMMNVKLKWISDWEVLTPTGFCDFKGVKSITKKNNIKIIYISNNSDKECICSSKHKLKLNNGEFKESRDITIDDIIFPNYHIKSIETSEEEIELYDLIGVTDPDNSYITNDIVSHNCAFIFDIDKIWTAAQQTLATGGDAIILSTPNGVGNFFHRTYVAAETGENNFNHILLPWTVHPERDQAWRDEQTKDLGDRLAAQECDASFLSSGNTVVPLEIIAWYKDDEDMQKDPMETRYFEDLWIWKYAEADKDYIVVADVARGDGNDYSTFHVFDIETLEQVAEYKSKVQTKEFGKVLTTIGHEYNNAILIIENANIGWAVLQSVIDLDYPNVYYSAKTPLAMDATTYTLKGYDLKFKEDLVPGFSTTTKTRPLLISKMELYMREKACIIHSTRLLNELEVFIWYNGKPQAQYGYNDDLVMAFAIAMFVRDTAIKLQTQGIELQKRTLGSVATSISSGVYESQKRKHETWQMDDFHGNKEDLTWLLDN